MTETKQDIAALSPDSLRRGLMLDYSLCFSLYAASATMTRLYHGILEPLGLTYPKYVVMMALWERSPRSVSDIATAVNMGSGAITPLLKSMEQAGLVTRVRDVRDQRRVVIDLTEHGDALRVPTAEVPGQIFAKLNTPVEDVRVLVRALKALNSNMLDHIKAQAEKN